MNQKEIKYPLKQKKLVYPFWDMLVAQPPKKGHPRFKKTPSKNKYKAKRTVIDGITFASQKESKRYQELKTLERHGVISGLKLQPVFVLQESFKTPQGETVRGIKYIADFLYQRGGVEVVEDTKGVQTDVFKLKRKLLLSRYPEIDLKII